MVGWLVGGGRGPIPEKDKDEPVIALKDHCITNQVLFFLNQEAQRKLQQDQSHPLLLRHAHLDRR